jgi:hypothetical protein
LEAPLLLGTVELEAGYPEETTTELEAGYPEETTTELVG